MSQNNTAKQNWQKQTALDRFRLISPLLRSDLDDAARVHLRKKLAEENGITIRTLYRYEKACHEQQFAGLKPKDREKRRSQKLPENFEELLMEASSFERKCRNAPWPRSSRSLRWRASQHPGS